MAFLRQRTSDEFDPGMSGTGWLQRQRGTVQQAERFHAEQVLDHLNAGMRAHFVGRQEMMVIATADRLGVCASSFRAGPAGFVRVLDERRLLWPEYRGNGMMASAGNVVDNPHISLLFVDFFRDLVGLHVNGRAEVVADDDVRDAHPALPVDPAPGRRPVHWLTVHVDEAFIHCSKHIPQLSKTLPDGQSRSRGNRADSFSARADRAAPVPGPAPSQDNERTDVLSRWSMRRLLTGRPAGSRSGPLR